MGSSTGTYDPADPRRRYWSTVAGVDRLRTGQPITLTTHGPATVTAGTGTGHNATLRVAGRFGSGATQITWTNRHSVLALRDFNIELD